MPEMINSLCADGTYLLSADKEIPRGANWNSSRVSGAPEGVREGLRGMPGSTCGLWKVELQADRQLAGTSQGHGRAQAREGAALQHRMAGCQPGAGAGVVEAIRAEARPGGSTCNRPPDSVASIRKACGTQERSVPRLRCQVSAVRNALRSSRPEGKALQHRCRYYSANMGADPGRGCEVRRGLRELPRGAHMGAKGALERGVL
jgi:hypothetical protein